MLLEDHIKDIWTYFQKYFIDEEEEKRCKELKIVAFNKL